MNSLFLAEHFKGSSDKPYYVVSKSKDNLVFILCFMGTLMYNSLVSILWRLHPTESTNCFLSCIL